MSYTVNPTLPLVQQAQDRLAAARKAEGHARLAWDSDRQSPDRQQAFALARKEHEEARHWMDQLQRSRDRLPAALEDARRSLYVAESTLAQVETQARQRITQARREVDQAREQLARVEADWLTIAGPEAVPAES
jgi:hypothetical protein